MSFGDLILTLLTKQKITFEKLDAPDAVSLKEDWLAQTVPLGSVSRVSILQDKELLVLALYPATHILNLEDLQNTLHRQFSFLETESITNVLNSNLKQPGFSVDKGHGIQIIIDEELSNQDYIHFESPQGCSVLRMKSSDVEQLSTDVLLGSRFSRPHEAKQMATKPKINLKQRLEKIDRLPAMPDMPSKILALRNNPNSTVDELVEIVEEDISLSSQIIRYSNSAMFTLNEPITSLKDAIFRVLGYDTVLHLSLGYALGRVFKLPEAGPLGHERFWQHSTYSAALVQHLANAMPKQQRPTAGLAYLAGLLHDIGFLVLNLFFKNEHAWLNKMMAANPDKSAIEMEQQLLGIGHNELGHWLMTSWEMPEELTITVQQHHNLNYDGPHATYALLVNLSERLLAMHGMSDSDTDEIPAELLERLHLNEEDVFEITDKVLQGRDTFKEMAVAVSA